MAPVEVSSDGSREGGEEDEEDEELESEETAEGTGETSPRHMDSILRTMPDNDEADTTWEEDPPAIPKRGRSTLISQGATTVQAPLRAGSSPSGAPSPDSGPPEAARRTKRLTGFKLGKRLADTAATDQ